MFGKIIGTGSYAPDNVVCNNDLKECRAAEKAIENAGISCEKIDLIIVSTVSSDTILPSTACIVQDQLKATNAMCFDINVACTGFITAYNIAQSYINAGLVETALVIGAEGLSQIVDWTDRTTAILFGDGAGAAIIKKDEKARFETVMHSDGSMGGALTCENSIQYRGINDSKKTFVSMNGQEVFRFAVRKVPECIEELISKMKIEKSEIDLFLLHQANKRILESIGKRLKVSMDLIPENVSEYGNTSSASIPILLDEMVRDGKIQKGNKIIMAGFGAGLTWSAVYLEF